MAAEGAVATVLFKREKITDSDVIAAMCDRIQFFIDYNCPRFIVFDFEQVRFFSSEVLGLLLEMRTKVAAWHGEVVISSLNPQLQRVFKVTNLDRIFTFYPDAETAIAAGSTVGGEK